MNNFLDDIIIHKCDTIFFLDENDSNVHLEIYCLWICKSIKFISNLYSCIFCYKLFDFLIALSNRAYYPIICKNGKKK